MRFLESPAGCTHVVLPNFLDYKPEPSFFKKEFDRYSEFSLGEKIYIWYYRYRDRWVKDIDSLLCVTNRGYLTPEEWDNFINYLQENKMTILHHCKAKDISKNFATFVQLKLPGDFLILGSNGKKLKLLDSYPHNVQHGLYLSREDAKTLKEFVVDFSEDFVYLSRTEED